MSIRTEKRCLFISDIHLFHRRNPTESIVKALKVYLEPYRRERPLDLLVIGGDLFDRLVEFQSTDVHEACLWVAWLLELCAATDIRLRVLEGTPRHDWAQSQIFVTLQQSLRLPVDCRYINTLCIEQMTDWDLSILYIPDEWSDTASKTATQVQDALQQCGLTQVDVAVMHGMFQYQLPVAAMMPSVHHEADYLKIVRYVISIGHVHSYSTYDRIIAQGSFDRLAHGEEEAKGGVEVTLYPDGRHTATFRENLLAKVFMTLTLKPQPLEAALTTIERKLKRIPKESHIRLRASKDHPAFQAFDSVKQQFPFFHWSKLALEAEELPPAAYSTDPEAAPLYRGITFTPENLPTLLLERIDQRHDCTDLQRTLLDQMLRAVI